ncbi:helix-turn-helix domain-containing protein [Shinella sp. DD12]|uniref:helix-turn-helix domain-containing protein n=1 Tax=Shinella sp. DD12 TaxID=1410620 RepID=UPI000437A49F|nr:helix-turn-helix domain-containing protein [Shinella sp. DD12]EYR83769.1 putative transcriptional regulator [Shinella sp. DD12]
MRTAQIKAPNAIDTEVGRRIRQRRAILGLSQSKLADELGVTFQQVQKYEKGTNRVGSSMLQNIARFLNVPISYFFDDIAELEPRAENDTCETMADFVISAEGLSLNRAFLSIKNDKVRRKFVAMVKALARQQDEDDPSEE